MSEGRGAGKHEGEEGLRRRRRGERLRERDADFTLLGPPRWKLCEDSLSSINSQPLSFHANVLIKNSISDYFDLRNGVPSFALALMPTVDDAVSISIRRAGE